MAAARVTCAEGCPGERSSTTANRQAAANGRARDETRQAKGSSTVATRRALALPSTEKKMGS
eukprot:11739806-Alexandrium_andersonii.AAC.1